MIVNEFGSNFIFVIKTFLTGIIQFWNDYLNYTLFEVNFNGTTYPVSALFCLTSLGLLIIFTMRVIDIAIPN